MCSLGQKLLENQKDYINPYQITTAYTNRSDICYIVELDLRWGLSFYVSLDSNIKLLNYRLEIHLGRELRKHKINVKLRLPFSNFGSRFMIPVDQGRNLSLVYIIDPNDFSGKEV